MKNSILKSIFLVSFLLLLIPSSAYSSEYVYKALTLDIPDCEVTGGGIANLPPYDSLLLSGKDWHMGFVDSGFMRHCRLISEIDSTVSCERQDRIQMLDQLIKENSPATQILFLSLPGDNIKRQEFKDYILYSSTGLNKQSMAILVDKRTKKTTEISGKFNDSQLKWLRLKPL